MSNKISYAKKVFALLPCAFLLSACTFMTPHATEYYYNPSDGLTVVAGDIRVNNIALVANEDGSLARLIGQITNNDTHSSLTATIEFEGLEPLTFVIDAGDFVNLQAEEIILENIGQIPGSSINATITNGTIARNADIPVIGGGLNEYKDLVPDAKSYYAAGSSEDSQELALGSSSDETDLYSGYIDHSNHTISI